MVGLAAKSKLENLLTIAQNPLTYKVAIDKLLSENLRIWLKRDSRQSNSLNLVKEVIMCEGNTFNVLHILQGEKDMENSVKPSQSYITHESIGSEQFMYTQKKRWG